MPPFFALYKGKPKTPAELVSKTQSALQALASGTKGKDGERAGKDATEYTALLVHLLLGAKATGAPPATGTPADAHATVSALLASEVLPLMLSHLSKLAFETRKDVVDIFAFICKYSNPPGSFPGLEFLRRKPYLLQNLVRGYEDTAVALNCGQMVRDAVGRDAALATSVLNSGCTERFFEYVQRNALEASDAFNTFKTLLVTHKEVTTAYLSHGDNYDSFFKSYEGLLKSTNYATQRQALSLLAHLLMDTFLGHEALMFKYIKSANNLMSIMNLLRAKSRSIQFEAFHVFKVFPDACIGEANAIQVFVANPNKPETIKGILISNREKLLRFLKSFLQEREEDDETFAAEKADIMAEIESLQQDPNYRLRPSSSMAQGMATSMSFSALHTTGDGESGSRAFESGSKAFEESNASLR